MSEYESQDVREVIEAFGRERPTEAASIARIYFTETTTTSDDSHDGKIFPVPKSSE